MKSPGERRLTMLFVITHPSAFQSRSHPITRQSSQCPRAIRRNEHTLEMSLHGPIKSAPCRRVHQTARSRSSIAETYPAVLRASRCDRPANTRPRNTNIPIPRDESAMPAAAGRKWRVCPLRGLSPASHGVSGRRPTVEAVSVSSFLTVVNHVRDVVCWLCHFAHLGDGMTVENCIRA